MSEFEITEQQEQALREMQFAIHDACVAAGWHTDLETGKAKKRNFGEAVALMHSELSEALEGWRKGLRDDHLPHRSMIEVELADCIIRILDTAGLEGLDIAGAISEKHAYNQRRADHKIENRRKDGGKKA
jgi:NTP pyrophosphatase (non-canonical NTP hydrolase)